MHPSDPNSLSIERYRRRAAGYDASAEATMPLRRRTIALLNLRPGDVVLDVGAGTGLSYELLLDGVGPGGRVLAFEQSPDMFALAEGRLARLQGAGPVPLWHRCASAETVHLPEPADAALFNYVHDITRTPDAVRNILSQLKPGARIAIAGMKFFPWWTGPLNLLAWAKNRPYNARPGDLWHPWDLLEPQLVGFERRSTMWGMGYLAWGRKAALPDHPAHPVPRLSPDNREPPARARGDRR